MISSTVTTVKIPSEIEEIIFSEYHAALAVRLRRTYKLLFEDKKIIDDAILLILDSKLTLQALPDYLRANLQTPQINIPALARDIVGTRLLIIGDYLKQKNQDVKTFIIQQGGKLEEYQQYIETARQALEEEKKGIYDHDHYLYEKRTSVPKQPKESVEYEETLLEVDLTPQERLESLERFFSSHLISLLKSEGRSEMIQSINHTLVLTLQENKEHQQKVLKILRENNMMIGSQSLVLETRDLPQTVSNWLKDFHHIVSQENFNSLSIVKYLINSTNAKKLSADDKAILQRLLLLYYNVMFFPTPFASLPAEQWNLIPSSSVLTKTPPTILAPKQVTTQLSKSSKSALHKIVKSPKQSIARAESKHQLSNSQVKSSPDLVALKNLLLDYPQGSLERQAIEEEIKKLEQT